MRIEIDPAGKGKGSTADEPIVDKTVAVATQSRSSGRERYKKDGFVQKWIRTLIHGDLGSAGRRQAVFSIARVNTAPVGLVYNNNQPGKVG